MQAEKHPIKSWAKDDRPREKLLSKSPAALTDSELIAILLGQGIRDMNAVELAKALLASAQNNLRELGKREAAELATLPGMGPVKAITIAAAFELGRRRQVAGVFDKPLLRDSGQVASHLRAILEDHCCEVFAVLFLNQANRVNHFEVVSQGGITGTVADPRVIMRKALTHQAVNLILCHNHPSGNLTPSKADEELTQKIRDAARLFDIRVIDHIIVSQDGYFSFADQGRL